MTMDKRSDEMLTCSESTEPATPAKTRREMLEEWKRAKTVAATASVTKPKQIPKPAAAVASPTPSSLRKARTNLYTTNRRSSSSELSGKEETIDSMNSMSSSNSAVNPQQQQILQDPSKNTQLCSATMKDREETSKDEDKVAEKCIMKKNQSWHGDGTLESQQLQESIAVGKNDKKMVHDRIPRCRPPCPPSLTSTGTDNESSDSFNSYSWIFHTMGRVVSRLLEFIFMTVSFLLHGSSTSEEALEKYKARVKELTTELDETKIRLSSSKSELDMTRQQLLKAEQTLISFENDMKIIKSQKQQTNETIRVLQEELLEYDATVARLGAVSSQLEQVKKDYKDSTEIAECRHKSETEKLKFQLRVLKIQQEANEGITVRTCDSGGLEREEREFPALVRARLEERNEKITELEKEVCKAEQVRRNMHNRIQELRGNIRVFVRVRPFLKKVETSEDSSVISSYTNDALKVAGKYEQEEFNFDKVFAPSASQEAVFDEVSEFVQSALDGYRVCLFAYGQTGSGKTHTMQGSGRGDMRGIIPRAVQQILSHAVSLKSQQWEFSILASFLEIYNEELHDLLLTPCVEDHEVGTFAEAPKLSIKKDAGGRLIVKGIKKEQIDTSDECQGLQQLQHFMATAARNRAVAATEMNADSSRSHSVFMLELLGTNNESGAVVRGALNLCDLAGSERLSRSGHDLSTENGMKRLKETQAINKSLSTLGDCFRALANGASHVPYRNSKLTYLLQDCLSGEGKALMMVNLSPTKDSSGESLCSLRFARSVNQIELGKATKNVHLQVGKKKNKAELDHIDS